MIGPHALHRTMVVVDVERFSSPDRTLPYQLDTRAAMYAVVRRALAETGLTWDACYHEDRGDSVLLLIPPDYPKAPLVEVLPTALARALREHNASNHKSAQARLRLVIHAGEVAFDDHGVTSSSLITAFRLLDAVPLKEALTRSPGVVAMIVSDRIFEDVVRQSATLDSATFRQVEVVVKELRDRAWIALPDHPFPSKRDPIRRHRQPRRLIAGISTVVLLAAGGDAVVDHQTATLHVASQGSSTAILTPWGVPLIANRGDINTLVLSPDGRTLASGGVDTTIRLWDVADPARPTALSRPVSGHSSYVFSVDFRPDAKVLASGSVDQHLRLWDLSDPTDPRLLGQPIHAHEDSINVVAFSPDGNILATGSSDTTIRLWDVSNPANPIALGHPLIGHTDVVTKVAFNHTGDILVSGGNDREVRLWNTAVPAKATVLTRPLSGHSDNINAMKFRPNDKVLATGGMDRTVRLWSLADPVSPTELGQPLTGPTGGIFAIAFTPDGKILAAGGINGGIWLWDVADLAHPRLLGQPVLGHSGDIHDLAFSPDGRMLVSGSVDRTIRRWRLEEKPR